MFNFFNKKDKIIERLTVALNTERQTYNDLVEQFTTERKWNQELKGQLKEMQDELEAEREKVKKKLEFPMILFDPELKREAKFGPEDEAAVKEMYEVCPKGVQGLEKLILGRVMQSVKIAIDSSLENKIHSKARSEIEGFTEVWLHINSGKFAKKSKK